MYDFVFMVFILKSWYDSLLKNIERRMCFMDFIKAECE